MSAKQKTYKGILRLRGCAISDHGIDARKYSTIGVGSYELHDIVVSQAFEKLLVPGEEIELALNGASVTAFIFAIFGDIMFFAAEIWDIDELVMPGIVVALISTLYWVASFINAGHEIYSVKIHDTLHRSKADVQYDDAASPSTKVPDSPQHEITVLTAGNLSDAVSHKAPETAIIKPLENSLDLSKRLEKHTGERAKTPDLSAIFNTPRSTDATRQTCPQCGTEALVMQEANIICGKCKVWMQVDQA